MLARLSVEVLFPDLSLDAVGLEKRADQRRLLLGAQGEAFIERDGREIGVHDCGCDGVLGAADDQRLVDELILRPPQPTDFVDHVLPARGLVRGNEKDLEIGPECCAAAKGGREPIGRNIGDFVAALPFGGIVLVIPRDDGGRNPLGQEIEALGVSFAQLRAQSPKKARARVSEECFERLEIRENLLDPVDSPRLAALQGPRGRKNLDPLVGPQRRSREEVVDCCMSRLAVIHYRLPPWLVPFLPTRWQGRRLLPSMQAPSGEGARADLPAAEVVPFALAPSQPARNARRAPRASRPHIQLGRRGTKEEEISVPKSIR